MRAPALHPRASFDIYSASVRGQCAPWKQRDVDAAAGLGLLVDDMTRSCGDAMMGDDADDSSALGLRMVRADDKRTRGEAEKTVAETKRLLESVRAPVFAVDEGFAVAQWNMMIQRLTGYTKPDMLGRRKTVNLFTRPHRVELRFTSHRLNRDRTKGVTAGYRMAQWISSGSLLHHNTLLLLVPGPFHIDETSLWLQVRWLEVLLLRLGYDRWRWFYIVVRTCDDAREKLLLRAPILNGVIIRRKIQQ